MPVAAAAPPPARSCHGTQGNSTASSARTWEPLPTPLRRLAVWQTAVRRSWRRASAPGPPPLPPPPPLPLLNFDSGGVEVVAASCCELHAAKASLHARPRPTTHILQLLRLELRELQTMRKQMVVAWHEPRHPGEGKGTQMHGRWAPRCPRPPIGRAGDSPRNLQDGPFNDGGREVPLKAGAQLQARVWKGPCKRAVKGKATLRQGAQPQTGWRRPVCAATRRAPSPPRTRTRRWPGSRGRKTAAKSRHGRESPAGGAPP